MDFPAKTSGRNLGTDALQHFHRLAFRRDVFRRFASRRFAFDRLARLSAAPAALALVTALGGCQTDDIAGARALKPLPPALAAEVDKRNMPRESPILVRIFKEEAELEVWKQDAEGKFAPLKTYPICRWSGELGPKVKQGDRQAPEGFYTITPGQMNPNSNYYLAFNLGFPNAYDKANDRSGDFLMVHGDCSSAGCYAMTDEQIQEIYALGRDSFLGGQKSFQVQAYPFRMTALNMARHRDNPNMPFWRMIKQGNDHFEVTRAEPHVDVCDKHYVFDAHASGNSAFQPREKCPAYEIPASIASAVKAKEASDERAMAEHVHRGVGTVAVRTGSDGGMHPLFLAKLQGRPTFDLQSMTSASSPGTEVKAPSGPLPAHVVPPRTPEPEMSLLSWARSAPAPGEATAASGTSTAGASTTGTSTMGTIGRWLGFGGGETSAAPAAATTAAVPSPKAKPAAAQTAAAKPAAKPKPDKPTETAQAPSASPAVH
jgi:murein L,D-transpeptidase YafK